MNKLISIIVPSFNEEGNIELLIQKISEVLTSYNYEIIFIDDGSFDRTLSVIESISKKDSRIKYISFSRNYGHQRALRAGLDHAAGDCVISMDADLQHPPYLLIEMIKKWEEGFEIVYTRRIDKENVSLFKKITANIFYKLLNSLSGLNMDQGAADFRLLDRIVVDVLKNMHEYNIFIRGMVSSIGFKKFAINYIPDKRFSGKSKYSIKKMFLFALEGITSFSIKPLHIATFIGLVIFIFSLLLIFHTLYIYFIKGIAPGYTSIFMGIFFMGGLQLLMLGIIGEYLGKLFIESKRRPDYIIRKKSF